MEKGRVRGDSGEEVVREMKEKMDGEVKSRGRLWRRSRRGSKRDEGEDGWRSHGEGIRFMKRLKQFHQQKSCAPLTNTDVKINFILSSKKRRPMSRPSSSYPAGEGIGRGYRAPIVWHRQSRLYPIHGKSIVTLPS